MRSLSQIHLLSLWAYTGLVYVPIEEGRGHSHSRSQHFYIFNPQTVFVLTYFKVLHPQMVVLIFILHISERENNTKHHNDGTLHTMYIPDKSE